jgi:uncharacterized membrane protein YjjP (DUF1212 family)
LLALAVWVLAAVAVASLFTSRWNGAGIGVFITVVVGVLAVGLTGRPKVLIAPPLRQHPGVFERRLFR